MIIRGFRVGSLRSPIKSKGDAFDPALSGALFLAPNKAHAIAWAIDLQKTKRNNHIYYVEVIPKGGYFRRKWGHLKEIVVFPPYEIIRWEKVKEIRGKDALIAHKKIFRGIKVVREAAFWASLKRKEERKWRG